MSARYRQLRELARGGMGTVELVVRSERGFERLYALKRILPVFREDPRVRAMFLEEARIAGLLRHPNVASVIDVGEDKNGPFLVMDYVDGLSVATLLARISMPLPISVALRVAQQVALGLAAAHGLIDHHGRALALVHRDVSPQNILIGFDGTVKVTDFGIAKAMGRTSETTTGILKGKLRYMSPEQLRFEVLDHRSDLYSLGVVLFELLASEAPFGESEGPEIARAILHEPPPDIVDYRPEIPPTVVELLFELLAKSPPERPASAAIVAGRLEDISSREFGEDEAPADLAVFLDQHFGDQKKISSERTRLALAAAQQSDAEGSMSTPVLPPDDTTRRDHPVRRWRGRGRGRWVAPAVGVALVGVGLVVAFRTGRGEPDAPGGVSVTDSGSSATAAPNTTREAPVAQPVTIVPAPAASPSTPPDAAVEALRVPRDKHSRPRRRSPADVPANTNTSTPRRWPWP